MVKSVLSRQISPQKWWDDSGGDIDREQMLTYANDIRAEIAELEKHVAGLSTWLKQAEELAAKAPVDED
jgi:hypothetical protein